MILNKPPMGWNTWNTFGENINEKLIIETVDALVESGLKDVGYEYIVIDDTWALKERNAEGRLVPDPVKFPNGIKYLSDYVHSKGLKFGIYSCTGYITCAGYPGSYDYEWIDAKTFAEWEIDFLKYDFCYHPASVNADILYKRMGLALANCGRDILFSACSWGQEYTKVWIKETGADMWRSTGDINDSWASIKTIAQSQLTGQEYNGKGCYNDMDMLVVGMKGKGFMGLTGCTNEEYKLHFSLWALLNSPLMIGCDIREMDEETKEILFNKDIIEINQDPAGRQPFFAKSHKYRANNNKKIDEPFYENYPLECPCVAKYLSNGDIAVGLFNFRDEKLEMFDSIITLDMLGLPIISGKKLVLKDLWTKEITESSNGTIPLTECAPHSCRIFRAKIVDA